MSKRFKQINHASRLAVGQRVAVIEKPGRKVLVRIGYVDSFSTAGNQVYVDYRWRKRRKGSVWLEPLAGKGNIWAIVWPEGDLIKIYVTDKSLHQVYAAVRKLHPEWDLLEIVS